MNCVCGCGTRLGRGQVDNNLAAGEVAIELVVWDKARTFGPPDANGEVEALIDAGASRYQRLLTAIHDDGEGGKPELEATREWLGRSRQTRARLSGVLTVPKKKISLSEEDQARIDRLHPERSFSGGRSGGGGPAGSGGVDDADLEALLAASTGEEYERLAVAWLGRLIAEQPPSLDELRWLLGRLEDLRSGRREEAEPALRRFLSERS